MVVKHNLNARCSCRESSFSSILVNWTGIKRYIENNKDLHQTYGWTDKVMENYFVMCETQPRYVQIVHLIQMQRVPCVLCVECWRRDILSWILSKISKIIIIKRNILSLLRFQEFPVFIGILMTKKNESLSLSES